MFEEAALLSPAFIVGKKTALEQPPKSRKVVDCRAVNREQLDVHFRMEGPETVQKLLQQNDYCTSLDLKSTFIHALVNRAMRQFLCFQYGQQCYSYRAMPFTEALV